MANNTQCTGQKDLINSNSKTITLNQSNKTTQLVKSSCKLTWDTIQW